MKKPRPVKDAQTVPASEPHRYHRRSPVDLNKPEHEKSVAKIRKRGIDAPRVQRANSGLLDAPAKTLRKPRGALWSGVRTTPGRDL